MKSILLYALTTLISLVALSQGDSSFVEFKLGDPFALKHRYNRVVKKDSSGYYVLSMSPRSSNLFHFGNDFKYITKVVSDFNQNNYKGVKEIGNESVVFETKKLKDNKIALYYKKVMNEPLGFELPVEIVQVDMEKKSSESDYFQLFLRQQIQVTF